MFLFNKRLELILIPPKFDENAREVIKRHDNMFIGGRATGHLTKTG